MTKTMLLALVAGLALTQPAFAQEEADQSAVLSTSSLPGSNTIFVRQDASGGTGNTLFVDQSGATGSLVAGNVEGTTAATQTGANNQADITIEGRGGTVLLTQGTATVPASDNVATLQLSGINPLATLEQFGRGNTAEMILEGPVEGVLRQEGDDNAGTLNVSGAGALGRLIQEGNDIEQSLTVTGNNTEVTYTLTGNSLAPVNSGAFSPSPTGVQVITNANSVTISQSAFSSR